MSGAAGEFEELRRELQRLRARVEQLEGENADLRRENAKLREALEEARRSGKRQAAPFSRGKKKEHPNKPGRKAGGAYGTSAGLDGSDGPNGETKGFWIDHACLGAGIN